MRKRNLTGTFYRQVVKGSLRQGLLPDEETEAAELWLGITNTGDGTQVSLSTSFSLHHAITVFFLRSEEQGPLGSLLELFTIM